MSPPGPTLHRLAAERQYARIPAHVQARPQDVGWQDHYGSTALHTLCLSQTINDVLLDAVDAILAEAPFLVKVPNHASWTPLHLACEKRLLWRTAIATASTAEEQLVFKLLRACPEAVSIPLTSGFKAKTPFHIACENNASAMVLREMLRINPSLAMQPSVKKQDPFTISDTPLQELWNVLCKSIDDEEEQHAVPDLTKMEILLKAAYAGNVDVEDADFHILCAACSVRCPRDYISQIIELHPHLIRQPDKNGLLPLHYAVQSAEPESPHYTSFLLDQLLNEYPEAAAIPIRPPRDGKGHGLLALHVLIADRGCIRQGGGIMRLIEAFPESLRIPDPRSGLVPVLSTAEAAIQSRMHLTTTYELLRAAPDVIQQH